MRAGQGFQARKLAWSLALVGALGVSLVHTVPAAAETTSSVNGNVITITVPVDVVGALGVTGPDGRTPLVTYWQQILDDTWNAALENLPYRDCYLLSLKVKLKARGDGYDGRDGWHRIILGAPTGGTTFRGTGFDGTSETSRNPNTGDGTRSFEHDRDGAIPEDAAPTVVAHEFGHLMGLGDDRKDGAPKPGRNDTMMVGGVPGVDLSKVPAVDQDLVDRVGEVVEQQLRNLGDSLPPCERWKGRFRGSFQFPGCTPGTSTGTMTLGVVDRTEVVGTLDITHTSYSCGPGTAPGATFNGVVTKGDKSRRRFSLSTRYGVGDFPIRLTISGPRAAGAFSFRTVPSSIDVDLRCTQHCPDENS